MQRNEAATLVHELLARYAGLEPSFVSDEMDVQEDLGLDSVDASELLITLEQRIGVGLELRDIAEIATVGRIVDKVVEAALAGTQVPDRACKAPV